MLAQIIFALAFDMHIQKDIFAGDGVLAHGVDEEVVFFDAAVDYFLLHLLVHKQFHLLRQKMRIRHTSRQKVEGTVTVE